MGLSKSKSKTTSTSTTAPSTFSMPFVNSAADTLKPAFDAATANNAALMPRVTSALDYYGSTLSGSRLNGNPYLQGVIDRSNQDITTGIDSRFSAAGRYGSGNYAGVLGKALADNENALRYQDYSTERGYQDKAAGSILGGVSIASALPQAAASNYADQVRALLGQYATQTGSGTSTQKQSIASILAQMAGNAASAFAAGG